MSKSKDKIENLAALMDAAKKRRAVICPKARNFCQPKPAGFLINLPGAVLLGLFRDGMYVYTKDGQQCRNTKE